MAGRRGDESHLNNEVFIGPPDYKQMEEKTKKEGDLLREEQKDIDEGRSLMIEPITLC